LEFAISVIMIWEGASITPCVLVKERYSKSGPRAPRIEFEDACYHIMARGNRKKPIVFNDEGRKLFVKTLSAAPPPQIG